MNCRPSTILGEKKDNRPLGYYSRKHGMGIRWGSQHNSSIEERRRAEDRDTEGSAKSAVK